MWRYLCACRSVSCARRLRPSTWSSGTVNSRPPVALPEKDRGRQERHQRVLDGLMRIFDQVKAIGDRDFLAFGRSARPIPTEKCGARKRLEDGLDGGFGGAPHDDQHPMGFFI